MIYALITVILLVVGVIFGTRAEKAHLANLISREAEFADMIVTNLKTVEGVAGREPLLVSGSVVIAFDYFRRFIAGFVMLVGGSITMYETMLDRARREALLRLLEQAREAGATQVHNVRFEFSRVGNSGGKSQVGGGAELLAYGTAI